MDVRRFSILKNLLKRKVKWLFKSSSSFIYISLKKWYKAVARLHESHPQKGDFLLYLLHTFPAMNFTCSSSSSFKSVYRLQIFNMCTSPCTDMLSILINRSLSPVDPNMLSFGESQIYDKNNQCHVVRLTLHIFYCWAEGLISRPPTLFEFSGWK